MTHIMLIDNKDAKAYGRYSLAGSVPMGCCDIIPADRSAVMGGRSWRNDAGEVVTYKQRTYATPAEAKQAIIDAGGTPCNIKGCACHA